MEIIFLLLWGVIWGFATNKVIENKGYDENWFWWGFFFGFIALIVTCAKPVAPRENNDRPIYPEYNDGRASLRSATASTPTSSSWICKKCGRRNFSYEYKCKCGMSKSSNFNPNISTKNTSPVQTIIKEDPKDQEKENLEKLKAYKELLDMGAITEEEFKEHKERLLNNSISAEPSKPEPKKIDDRVWPVLVNDDNSISKPQKTYWTCPKCRKNNDLSRRTCLNCGEPK